MRPMRELLIDAWSWLNYKQAMADPNRPAQHAFPELNTSWVPAEDLRRLAAYKFLTAYDSNRAGQLAAVTTTASADADNPRKRPYKAQRPAQSGRHPHRP